MDDFLRSTYLENLRLAEQRVRDLKMMYRTGQAEREAMSERNREMSRSQEISGLLAELSSDVRHIRGQVDETRSDVKVLRTASDQYAVRIQTLETDSRDQWSEINRLRTQGPRDESEQIKAPRWLRPFICLSVMGGVTISTAVYVWMKLTGKI